MSQVNNIKDRNLLLRTYYSSRAVSSSTKLFHAILKNDANNLKKNQRKHLELSRENTINRLLNYIDKKKYHELAGLSKNSPILLSTKNNDYEGVKNALKIGESTEVTYNNGSNALMISTQKRNFQIIKLLLEYGANVNCKGDIISPLKWSLATREIPPNIDIIKELLKYGADIHENINVGDTRKTSFIRATTYHSPEISKLFYIIDCLDKNDSVENLTLEDVKKFYYTQKDDIDYLMKQRKESQLAWSIVHNPYNVVIHDNFDIKNVIEKTLNIIRANDLLGGIAALGRFPIRTSNGSTPSNWNFDIFEKTVLFFTLKDLGILAQLNKEFRNAFSLIRQNDGIEILINANKNRLAN